MYFLLEECQRVNKKNQKEGNFSITISRPERRACGLEKLSAFPNYTSSSNRKLLCLTYSPALFIHFKHPGSSSTSSITFPWLFEQSFNSDLCLQYESARR